MARRQRFFELVALVHFVRYPGSFRFGTQPLAQVWLVRALVPFRSDLSVLQASIPASRSPVTFGYPPVDQAILVPKTADRSALRAPAPYARWTGLRFLLRATALWAFWLPLSVRGFAVKQDSGGIALAPGILSLSISAPCSVTRASMGRSCIRTSVRLARPSWRRRCSALRSLCAEDVVHLDAVSDGFPAKRSFHSAVAVASGFMFTFSIRFLGIFSSSHCAAESAFRYQDNQHLQNSAFLFDALSSGETGNSVRYLRPGSHQLGTSRWPRGRLELALFFKSARTVVASGGCVPGRPVRQQLPKTFVTHASALS